MSWKVTANGEDITDLCYWGANPDVVRGQGAPRSVQRVYPFADKAPRLAEAFRKLGDFMLVYYGNPLRSELRVRYQSTAESPTTVDGHLVVEITLKILA